MYSKDLVWRTVDERKVIPVNPTEPLDTSLFDEYDICVTGAAMKQFENQPSWKDLVQNTWVYARVSPSQKEYILTSLKTLGYITLMAGDGTNDVGALKQAHIGVALLNGTPEDLEKIAERMKHERIKAEAQKLGFKRAVLPRLSAERARDVTGIELVPVGDVSEAMSALLEG